MWGGGEDSGRVCQVRDCLKPVCSSPWRNTGRLDAGRKAVEEELRCAIKSRMCDWRIAWLCSTSHNGLCLNIVSRFACQGRLLQEDRRARESEPGDMFVVELCRVRTCTFPFSVTPPSKPIWSVCSRVS